MASPMAAIRSFEPTRCPATAARASMVGKLFRVDEIREFTMLDEIFEARQPGYMRNGPTMTKIYCEL